MVPRSQQHHLIRRPEGLWGHALKALHFEQFSDNFTYWAVIKFCLKGLHSHGTALPFLMWEIKSIRKFANGTLNFFTVWSWQNYFLFMSLRGSLAYRKNILQKELDLSSNNRLLSSDIIVNKWIKRQRKKQFCVECFVACTGVEQKNKRLLRQKNVSMKQKGMGIVSKGIVSKSDNLSSYVYVSFEKFHNSLLTDCKMSLLLCESQKRNQTYLTYPYLLRQLSTNFRNRNKPHLVKWLQCRQLVTPSAWWDVQGVFSRRANNTLSYKSSSPQDCRVSSMEKHLFVNLRFLVTCTKCRTSFRSIFISRQ